jgi:hypothetical protein
MENSDVSKHIVSLIDDTRMFKFLRPLLRSLVQNVDRDRFLAPILRIIEDENFAGHPLAEVIVTEALSLDGEPNQNQIQLLALLLRNFPTIFREASAKLLEQREDKASLEKLLEEVGVSYSFYHSYLSSRLADASRYRKPHRL